MEMVERYLPDVADANHLLRCRSNISTVRERVRVLEKSRAEPGCLYYQPFTDVENPEKLVVIEAGEA